MNTDQHDRLVKEVIVQVMSSVALEARSRQTADKAINLLNGLLLITTPDVPVGSLAWCMGAEFLKWEAGEEASLLGLQMLDTYNYLKSQL
jgi:hypothetical protein